jgi:hypothetical protein
MSEFMQHVEKHEWTQEKPTVNGFYWTWWHGRKYAEVQEVCGYECDLVYAAGSDISAFTPSDTDGWWWLGPIAVPDPPEIASN